MYRLQALSARRPSRWRHAAAAATPAGRRLLGDAAKSEVQATLPASFLPKQQGSTAAAAGTVQMRVIEGDPAAVDDYPFVVALLANGGLLCGGTLLDATSVLTGE